MLKIHNCFSPGNLSGGRVLSCYECAIRCKSKQAKKMSSFLAGVERLKMRHMLYHTNNNSLLERIQQCGTTVQFLNSADHLSQNMSIHNILEDPTGQLLSREKSKGFITKDFFKHL